MYVCSVCTTDICTLRLTRKSSLFYLCELKNRQIQKNKKYVEEKTTIIKYNNNICNNILKRLC